ncbi:MAG: hypothetical protein AAGC47_15955 [Bacteroidota bacterium]
MHPYLESGNNLYETPMMAKYKVCLIGFYRNGEFISDVDATTTLHEGNELIIFGTEHDLREFKAEWDARPVLAEST